MVQDTSQIKDKIIMFLKINGPSLPVHLSGEIKSTILFTSAFLSELVSEKKVKMSSMRVGSSPVYFLPGQESRLERFSEHLKSKEKEAFALLKEKNFLIDSAQQPAIRVALRGIRDFALPFKIQDSIIWRYFLVPETEYKAKAVEVKEEKPLIRLKEKPLQPEVKKEVMEEKSTEVREKPKREKRKTIRKAAKSQQKEKFLENIKSFISEKAFELKSMEGITKNEIILRVSDNGEEKILVAYNKRKISDGDILKAHKKISKFGLPYLILGLGEPSKKITELVRAAKDLSAIHWLNKKE